jgi:hypothetical protein
MPSPYKIIYIVIRDKWLQQTFKQYQDNIKNNKEKKKNKKKKEEKNKKQTNK